MTPTEPQSAESDDPGALLDSWTGPDEPDPDLDTEMAGANDPDWSDFANTPRA